MTESIFIIKPHQRLEHTVIVIIMLLYHFDNLSWIWKKENIVFIVYVLRDNKYIFYVSGQTVKQAGGEWTRTRHFPGRRGW